MIEHTLEIILLLNSLFIIWISSRYILDTNKMRTFIPFLIFGFIMTIVFALMFNKKLDSNFQINIQIINLVLVYFATYNIFKEVLK